MARTKVKGTNDASLRVTPEMAGKDINDVKNSASKTTTKRENSAKMYRGTYVGGVWVSAKTSEAHSMASTVVETALESGAVVSDHVIVKPESITVTFVVSNVGQGAAGKSGMARTVFEAFRKMRDERTLVELETDHAVYKDVVLSEFTPVESAPYKGALSCTCVFKKIYFVSLLSVGRQPGQLGGVAAKTDSAPREKGQQEPEPIDETRLSEIARQAGLIPSES